jgi:hypothetical protein
MGLLDDAIREHLELKRRHGASEDEVERKAAEAFGPVRRERAEAPPAADESPVEAPLHEVAPADDPYADVPPEPIPPAPPLEEPPLDEPPLAAEPELAEPPVLEAPPVLDEPPVLEAPPAVEPAAPEEPTEQLAPEDDWEEPPRSGSTEPRGFPAVAREPEPETEDVLEETPDFLQDAPEHDRLWFEQKPPRDFDFDG